MKNYIKPAQNNIFNARRHTGNVFQTYEFKNPTDHLYDSEQTFQTRIKQFTILDSFICHYIGKCISLRITNHDTECVSNLNLK